jgi:type II secretory pathway pseudopilin PulG
MSQTNTAAPHAAPHAAPESRAYTLIEMMIVMVILIVVMALVAPVIGNARNAAKKTNTQQLLNNLGQASQQFELANRVTPGFFSPADMASTVNGGNPATGGRGFSEMNNILLDLAGGRFEAGTGNPPPDAIQVGPTGTATTYVRVGLIGAPTQSKGVVNSGYFTPDPKYFLLQDATDAKRANVDAHLQLPDLVDGFGQPLLAWRQDIEPSPSIPFAAMEASTRASFYWAPNAAFILSKRLGKKEIDQTNTASGENGSLLSRASFQDIAVAATMRGLLGNPAFPSTTVPSGSPDQPAAARGKLIFHSAGTDGSYLGVKDRGGLIATAPNSPFHTQNVADYRGGRDPLDNFDDVISVAGN